MRNSKDLKANIRALAFILTISCLFHSSVSRGQACGIWTVTSVAELTAAATATCAAGGGIIQVSAGTYNIDNPLVFCSNVTVEGGFNAGFTSKSSTLGLTLLLRSSLNPEGGVGAQRLVAIYLNNASNFRFQDISIQTVDGTSAGMSSYGVHLTNCSNYDFVRTQIIAGNGSDGPDGVDGVNGADGGGGTNGADGNNDDQNDEGIGGSGGSGGGVGSGTGGIGGSLGGCCNNGDPGDAGGNAANARAGSGGGGGGSGGQEERPGGAGGIGGAFSGPTACSGNAGTATGCQGNNGG
ncbi:MAG: hypothetical protein JKX73_06200, partial [Flavobacteriales bacterium]|nr:hypothetical protein [Flavobacteriales bacterium]